MIYKVKVFERIIEARTVEVEADSVEAAEAAAIHKIVQEGGERNFIEVIDRWGEVQE